MDEQLLERLRSQLTFLIVIDEQLESCTDELQRTLLNAMRALAEAGAPVEEIMPLVDLYSGKGPGKKRRKVGLRCTLAIYSAAVTALKKGRPIDAVIAEVATPNGISRKELKNFRDRLNRGLADAASMNAYKSALSSCEKMTKAEILSFLARTRERFVSDPDRV
jgi:hypothetical protein